MYNPLLELCSHWWKFTLIQLSEANEFRSICTLKGQETVD